MNTDCTEKFVNAIACDLEEGGFRQVSGTTLRRTLATAVSAALPLLEAGNPVSELAEQEGLAFDFDDARERFEEWAKGRDLTPDTWGVSSYVSPHVDNDWDVWRAAWKALATTGKQQVGEVQGDARRQWLEIRGLAAGIVKNLKAFAESPHNASWCGALDDSLSFADQIEKDADAAYTAALAARQPGAEKPIGYRWRHSAGEKWQYSDVPCGWEHEPVYAALPAQGIDLGPFTRLADAWVLAAHDAGEREGKVLKEAIMLMAVKELRDTVEQVSQRDAAPGVV